MSSTEPPPRCIKAEYRTVGNVSGLPLNWRDEVSGVLVAAVHAYYDGSSTDEQLELVAAFLRYYIAAPCWTATIPDESSASILAQLRLDAAGLKTAEDINRWLARCLDIGLDPL